MAELPSPKSDMLGKCLDMAGRGPGSIFVLVGVEGIEYIYKNTRCPKKYYFTFCLIYSMIWQCDCIDIADNGDLLVTMGDRG